MEYLHDHWPDTVYVWTPRPRKGSTVSGYGNNLPTQWMVRVGRRWHRVRAICWSNAATFWVRVRGKKYIWNCCYSDPVNKETADEGL